MFQRLVVISLLVLGLCFSGYQSYVAMSVAHVYSSDHWTLAIVGGVMASASLIYLSGVSVTQQGLRFKDNLAGLILSSKSKDGKDAELVHCTVYISAFVASFILFLCAMGVIGFCSAIIDALQGNFHFRSSRIDLSLADLGYVVLMICGTLTVLACIGWGIIKLSVLIGRKTRMRAETAGAVLIFISLFLIVAGIDFYSQGGAVLALKRTLWMFLSLGYLLAILTLICFPFWIHHVLRRFFPGVYRKICPVVASPSVSQ